MLKYPLSVLTTPQYSWAWLNWFGCIQTQVLSQWCLWASMHSEGFHPYVPWPGHWPEWHNSLYMSDQNRCRFAESGIFRSLSTTLLSTPGARGLEALPQTVTTYLSWWMNVEPGFKSQLSQEEGYHLLLNDKDPGGSMCLEKRWSHPSVGHRVSRAGPRSHPCDRDWLHLTPFSSIISTMQSKSWGFHHQPREEFPLVKRHSS